ncbi:radical SAM protein [Geomonas paludis]|uniref:Nitrogenase molybdenum-iron cofactor biosynthesis radical SAM domain iron-sulfur cluster-binding oxidoreductase n=1 Tax=Geomonas paludis TaxID=2740185 RepID=A0A6V8MV59_9BACT|nr:radical SAM protein [Geomonas paludis]GFO63980.1 nitrogenase molybdenum-iron cofactor biosynthesis radical SAM domain iron-sulfur cluster-binding oxidoreductase [Geomonas paludis]
MATSCTRDKFLHGHPCFGGDRHRNGRIHLAVAPRCNITCGYCDRRHDCTNESRPGVTSRLLTPPEALERVRGVMAGATCGSLIRVIGIAGPGDPLANAETFETFTLVQREFPDLLFCLSTNGLALPDRIDHLSGVNLHSLTVTINAADPEVGGRIYREVRYRGRVLRGAEGAETLIRNQFEGVRVAAQRGMVVKVNTVLIPGINEEQIPLVAQKASEAGAFVMNVMPIIPQANLAHVPRPTPEHLEQVRSANEATIAQFRGCQQCRADAVGLIGGCARSPQS